MTVELGAAFLLGLLGSAHCVGMCGPIAIALAVGPDSRAAFVAGRVAYNAGRVLTYSLLGIPVGLLGGLLHWAGFQQALSILSGVAVLLGALAYLGWIKGWHATTPPRWFGALQGAWTRLFSRRSLPALTGIGVLNGLLPCGLVYAALAGAAATGSAQGGAAFMFTFGLGTFPVMLSLCLAGRTLRGGFLRYAATIVPLALLALAGLLVLRGLGLGIPYLSPNLQRAADGENACCHGHAESP